MDIDPGVPEPLTPSVLFFLKELKKVIYRPETLCPPGMFTQIDFDHPTTSPFAIIDILHLQLNRIRRRQPNIRSRDH